MSSLGKAWCIAAANVTRLLFCSFTKKQVVVISLEDICHMDEAKSQQQQFHFAMSGKSFDIITEHFPDMMQKVTGAGPLSFHDGTDCILT